MPSSAQSAAAMKQAANEPARHVGSHLAARRRRGARLNEASANVETAAAAAEELSASIKEISRRLAQTGDVVRTAAADAQPPTTTSPRLRTWRSASATWSSSFRTSPNRPTCWRSTPPSRRRAPAKPAAALRWSPPRSSRWRCRPPRRPSEITKEISSVQSSTGDAVAAIRAITQRMQDINAHTAEWSRHRAAGTGDRRDFAQCRERRDRRQSRGVRAGDVAVRRDADAKLGKPCSPRPRTWKKPPSSCAVKWKTSCAIPSRPSVSAIRSSARPRGCGDPIWISARTGMSGMPCELYRPAA